jgi:hypothetical protein
MTNTVGVLDKNGTLLTGLTASEIEALPPTAPSMADAAQDQVGADAIRTA